MENRAHPVASLAARKAAGRALPGFTLAEVMLAAVIVSIAALGTLSFQYMAQKHIRVAEVELTATRIGQLLIEDYKSTGGMDDYNPEYLDMGFEMPSAEESGHVAITIDDARYYINMSHNTVDSDDTAGTELRRIDVIVRWKKNFGRGKIKDGDPGIALSTYVRRDQD